MTRARSINVGGMAQRSVLAAAIAAAMVSKAHGREPLVIENRGQALPKGAQRAIYGGGKAQGKSKRAAANELVEAGQRTIVLAHLHPRWLRRAVNNAMTLGARVTANDIDRFRAAGHDDAAHADLLLEIVDRG